MTPKHITHVFRLAGAALVVLGLLSPASAAGVFTHASLTTPWTAGGAGGGRCCGCKNINIWKQINIWKAININKPVTINKSIVINKGGVAVSIANAAAAAGAAAVVYGGGSYAEETVINRGGEIGELHTAETCEAQEATVVKAIHAICVAPSGEEFPASHMLADTWIEASYEGEVARCIAGATLKVIVGDVLQSDKGMAGTYEHGQLLRCGEHEALRHYKDGMLKCVPSVAVRDCTERTNLRKYGTADFFFTYRTNVCATREATTHEAEVSSVTLEGGVGN
ncbi:MAG TPA: hypothetical protein VHT03_04660 [Rhizomicrobium sp.]|jgi:hypothetical protein|nr:hypothetical protein [Rhizomicrobium sp.]